MRMKSGAGTDLTFFDIPYLAPTGRGRATSRTGLRVEETQALAYWQERLAEHGVTGHDQMEQGGPCCRSGFLGSGWCS